MAGQRIILTTAAARMLDVPVHPTKIDLPRIAFRVPAIRANRLVGKFGIHRCLHRRSMTANNSFKPTALRLGSVRVSSRSAAA